MMSILHKANLNSVASLVSTTLSKKVFPALSSLTPFSAVSPFSPFHNLLFLYLPVRCWYFLGFTLSQSLFSIPCTPMATFPMLTASSATRILMTAQQYLVPGFFLQLSTLLFFFLFGSLLLITNRISHKKIQRI